MELQTVSKEIAIQLKELGFDWNCDKQFAIEGEFDVFEKHGKVYCKQPTQALVCKWFREKHKLDITIIPVYVLDSCIHRKVPFTYYKCTIYGENLAKQTTLYSVYNLEQYNNIGIDWDNYEQAEEAGIIKAIELLKNTKENENIQRS